MNDDHIIKALTPDDANALLHFYRSRPPWIVHWFDPFPQQDAEKIGNHLAQASAGVAISMGLLAPGGTIVGHGFIVELSTAAPGFGIGLAESVIGGGWGRALMTAVMTDADNRQVPKVTLTVFKDNIRARRLYESFGFVITGECKCRLPGDSLTMERLCGGVPGGGMMDELDKGLAIAISGPQRAAALKAFHEQIQTCGVALPPVEPLVLDFGLGEFAKTGLIEYWIANEMAAGYCGKYLFVFDGQTCPRHRHAVKHETFFVVKGRVRMTCGGRTFEMGEGDVLPVLPGHFHSFTGLGPALLLELSMPCEIDDNDFADARIPIGRRARTGEKA